MMRRLFVVVLLMFLLTACGTLTDDGTGLMFRTADPRLNIGVRLLPPAVIPAEEVGESVPDPLPTPPCEIVKGNISKDGRKLYHIEGMRNFGQVKIDESKGERFFCDTASAEDAGWAKAAN